MTQITPEMYIVDGVMGGHVYVIVDGDITIVDTGVGKSKTPTIKGLGHGSSDIKRIIIIHAHVDHIGGLKVSSHTGCGG